ncbi:hypothetical protein DL96DRAFT_1591129 [Flagelloscypha sp. PMI_526]|nr:hypothetical protein DL96DRAFT_1591129 [Flagelloscypha sp. PMI_526]
MPGVRRGWPVLVGVPMLCAQKGLSILIAWILGTRMQQLSETVRFCASLGPFYLFQREWYPTVTLNYLHLVHTH